MLELDVRHTRQTWPSLPPTFPADFLSFNKGCICSLFVHLHPLRGRICPLWNLQLHLILDWQLFYSGCCLMRTWILIGPVRGWPHPAAARLLFNFVTRLCSNLCFILKRSFHQLFWPLLLRLLPFALLLSLSESRATLGSFLDIAETEFHTAPLDTSPPPPPVKSLDKPLLISRSVPCHCRGPVHNLFLDVFCPSLSGVRKHRAACSDIWYHLMPSKLLISIKKGQKKSVQVLLNSCKVFASKQNCTVSSA